MLRSKTDPFLSLEDTQVRAQAPADMAVLLHFSSITQPGLRQIWHCTPQCETTRSRTDPASPLKEFFPLQKFWVFPQRACMLSAKPKMGTNVSAHPQRQKKGYTLCLVIIVLSMLHNTTKQQGNALGCKFIYKMLQIAPYSLSLPRLTSDLQIPAVFTAVARQHHICQSAVHTPEQ